MKQIAFFIIFKVLSLQKMKLPFWENGSGFYRKILRMKDHHPERTLS